MSLSCNIQRFQFEDNIPSYDKIRIQVGLVKVVNKSQECNDTSRNILSVLWCNTCCIATWIL